MAAELRLGVSFDLVYFRQQLGKLSQIAASEFSGKVKLNIDKRDFQRQMAGLTKELRINVNDSQIVGARTNLGKLNQSIATFRRAVAAPIEIKVKYTEQGKPPVGFGGTASRAVTARLGGAQALQNLERGQLQGVYKTFKAAGMAVGDLANGLQRATVKQLQEALVPAFSDSAEEAVNGLAIGLKDGSSKVSKAAEKLGEDTLRSIKDVLGIASPSREFKKVGEDSGEGFEQGLKSGLGEATRMGIQEMRSLFRALQGEAQSGAARLQATMLAAMAGIVQLPGGRQQRGRLMQTGSGINAAMTGPALGNIQARQATVRGAAASAPAFAAALPLMFGMDPRELTARLQGLYGQQYRAPGMGGRQTPRPGRIASLIAALASSGGGFGAGSGVNQRLFTGGAINPGVLPSGYIGRSAISPGFVNYPAGMPPAYGTGFIEPTAFGSLAAGTVGRYGMGIRDPRFPLSAMMTGGFGAGGGSFIPESASRGVNGFSKSISGLTEKVKGAAEKVKGATGVVRSVLIPTFGDMRKQVVDMNRSIAVSQNAVGSMFYGKYMTPQGKLGMYDFPTAGMMGPSSPIGPRGRFPSDGMMYPSSPLGVINAQSSMFGGAGGGGGGGFGGGGVGGGAGGPLFPGGAQGPASRLPPGYNFLGTLPGNLEAASQFLNQRNIPLTGAIRELAGEFSTAVKQVLLFGTAYKALAFFTSLPGQAFDAAKNLETFRNQLAAVTETTGQFGPSLSFIERSISQLNVPINSAREGFTRLYASLQPAGFDPGTIQNLFTGITQASATFGLSADQVDRVFYAFGQMASKGQVMSEELKGQLGDVLPGSVALFAEAAQMSMTEFTQALEDGMFKGDAMKVLLENVATLMTGKFSDAATKASKTLQGQLNAIQNSIQLMYEALQPLVNAFAATFGPVLQDLIKDATEVIQAFTNDIEINGEAFNLLSPRAQDFYSILKDIIPSVSAAASNIGDFAASLGVFIQPLATAIKLGLDFLAIPFVSRLALYALTVAGLTTAFQLLVSTGIVQATAAVIRFIATLSITQIRAWIAGIQSAIQVLVGLVRSLNFAVVASNAARIALVALKVTLVSFGVGAVLVGLDFVAQKLFKIGDAAEAARQRAAALTDELANAVETGNTKLAFAKLQESETEVQSFQKAISTLKRLEGAQGTGAAATQAEYETLKRTGLASGISFGRGRLAALNPGQVQANLEAAQSGYVAALNRAGEAQEAYADATEVMLNMQRQRDASRGALKPIPPGGGDGEGEEGKSNKLKEYTSDLTRELKAQLAARLAAIDADTNIFKREKELQKARATLEFENKILIEQARLAQEEAAQFTPETRGLFLQERLNEAKQVRAKLESDYVQVVAGPLTNAVESYSDALGEEVEKLELVNAGVDELSATQKANKLIRDSLLEVTDEDLDKVPELREKIEALKQAILDLGKAIDETRGKSFIGDLLNKIKEERAVLQAPLGQEGLVELRQQLRRNQLPEEQAEEIFEEQEINRKLAVTKQAVADLAGTINSSIGDALSSVITDFNNLQEVGLNFLRTLADGFKQLASTIIQEATRAFVNNAVSKLFNFLAPALGAAAGGLFSGNASISGGGFGSFDGGSFGVDTSGALGQVGANLSARPFATGGIVTGPTLGLVGEGRFNEAVVPLPNGKSIPVDLGNGAGNNISTNIVVNVNNGQASSQVNGSNGQAFGRELEGAVRSVILKESRPGGIIYNQR